MAQSGNVNEAVLLAGSHIQLEIWTRYGDQASVMRRAYRMSSPLGTGRTFGQVLTHFAALVPVVVKPLLHQSAFYAGLGIRGVKGFTLSNAAPAYDDANSGIGTGGLNPLPSQVAGLVTLVTNSAGRHGRGRVYVPFPAQSDVSGLEVPTAAYVAKLDSLGGFLDDVQTVAAGGNSVTLTPCIVNRDLISTIDIVNFRSRTKWATQRRRGDYGPGNATPF
jgi:hypothetical protein